MKQSILYYGPRHGGHHGPNGGHRHGGPHGPGGPRGGFGPGPPPPHRHHHHRSPRHHHGGCLGCSLPIVFIAILVTVIVISIF